MTIAQGVSLSQPLQDWAKPVILMAFLALVGFALRVLIWRAIKSVWNAILKRYDDKIIANLRIEYWELVKKGSLSKGQRAYFTTVHVAELMRRNVKRVIESMERLRVRGKVIQYDGKWYLPPDELLFR